MDKLKNHSRIRGLVQILWAIVSNGNISGFRTGEIYGGNLKNLCVPGLNCYSCPGALGSCPIGSMQAFLSARHPKVPFYVLGFLSLIGVFFGRLVCGWLCIFGYIQELLYKVPLKKINIPNKVDRYLRMLKYMILVVFVILLPIILRDEMGISFPYFCKYICPAGMLEGGIPLLILNKAMRPAAHFLYVWKFIILLIVVLLSIVINRPFCKYICPLGAFYGLFNRISFMQLSCNHETCVSCGACSKVCKMQVDPVTNAISTECIRCGDCVKVCPANSLNLSLLKKKEQK